MRLVVIMNGSTQAQKMVMTHLMIKPVKGLHHLPSYSITEFYRKGHLGETGLNKILNDSEAVRTMGTDFSMIQLLFPDKTRHQIKLKFKSEDKKNRLCLDDAINSHAKAHSRDLWIEQVKLASTKAEDPSGDASDFMMAEEAVDRWN